MHIDTELDCGNCQLRALGDGDLSAIARHANNPNVAAWLRDRFPHPYEIEDAERFLEYIERAPGECVAVICVGDEAVGAIGLQFRTDVERCSAELGYWLGEPFWRRGIATAAIRAFTSWAMPRFELTRIYAEVFDENPASARVLEKAGFRRVGILRNAAIKRGEYHDYILYDLVRLDSCSMIRQKLT
jgi:RimJ/RimL family protein N-acetyltransferase